MNDRAGGYNALDRDGKAVTRASATVHGSVVVPSRRRSRLRSATAATAGWHATKRTTAPASHSRCRLGARTIIFAGVGYVSLSEEELRGFAESEAKDPAIAKLYSLEREFAETRGGRILDVWKLSHGRIFGLPWMMTLDEVARRLGITEEEANAAAAEVTHAVIPLWHATPEYRASRYRVMHERRARGLPPLLEGGRVPTVADDTEREAER